MECPRCDGPLVRYSLEDVTAVVCEHCGYVGVPADHVPEPEEDETWEEALDRFRRERS